MSISLDELIEGIVEADRGIRDFSCRSISVYDFGEHFEILERAAPYRVTRPRITEEFIWVKRPFKMRTEDKNEIHIVKKEKKEDKFSCQTFYKGPGIRSLGRLSEPRTEDYAWPLWPSPDCLLKSLQ